MLIAILNTCSKEELEDDDPDTPIEEENELPQITSPEMASEGDHDEEDPERRSVIKNKIMAVGKIARVFALLREESEKASELKSLQSTGRLPADELVSGIEGAKEAIQGFDDARRSDIENERLPPDLIEADADAPMSPASKAQKEQFSTFYADATPGTPGSNMSGTDSLLGSPMIGSDGPVPGTAPFKRGHQRNSSLGTTPGSSPSTRKQPLTQTINRIREVLEGTDVSPRASGADAPNPSTPKR